MLISWLSSTKLLQVSKYEPHGTQDAYLFVGYQIDPTDMVSRLYSMRIRFVVEKALI